MAGGHRVTFAVSSQLQPEAPHPNADQLGASPPLSPSGQAQRGTAQQSKSNIFREAVADYASPELLSIRRHTEVAREIAALLQTALRLQTQNLISLEEDLFLEPGYAGDGIGCSKVYENGSSNNGTPAPFVRPSPPALLWAASGGDEDLSGQAADGAPLSPSAMLQPGRRNPLPLEYAEMPASSLRSHASLQSYTSFRSHASFAVGETSLGSSSGSSLGSHHEIGSRSHAVETSVAQAWLNLSEALIAHDQMQAANTGLLSIRCLNPIWVTDELPLYSLDSTSKYFCLAALDDGIVDSMIYSSQGTFMLFLQSLVVRPSSPIRFSWDIIALLVLIYDVITLPLKAFDYDNTPVATIGYFIGSCFWTLDLTLSFFRGYMTEGGIAEMRIYKIWRNYLQGWFVIDFLVLAADWASIILLNNSRFAAARAAKLGRFSSALRFLRFVRLLHLPSNLMPLRVTLSSSATRPLHLLGLLALPICVSHFIACGWYWVGTNFSPGESWLDSLKAADKDSKLSLYVICFHWSICQYTPAPNSIQAVTLAERVFSVVALLIGFVIFTSFLGSATSMVTTARIQSAKRLQEDWNLRRFISDHNVSFRLCHRIGMFAKQLRESPIGPAEKDISLFQALPERMLVRLHYEVYGRQIRKHPLFSNIESSDRGLLVLLAHKAAQSQCHARFDEVFHFGSKSEWLLCVTDGSMRYTPGYKARHANLNVTTMAAGSFLCEAALWMVWFHQGEAISQRCHIVAIHTEGFMTYVSSAPHVLASCRSYARAFVTKCGEICGVERFYHILKSKEWGCKIPNLDDLGLLPQDLQALANSAFATLLTSASTKGFGGEMKTLDSLRVISSLLGGAED